MLPVNGYMPEDTPVPSRSTVASRTTTAMIAASRVTTSGAFHDCQDDYEKTTGATTAA